MRLKNKLSPYPILDDYGDDYINSSFTAEYDIKTQFSEVYGRILFRLHNGEIEELIKSKQAEYLVHIECPSTCFRYTISSDEPAIEFRIDSRKLSRVIEIRTFIVLTQNVDEFTSENFHPDYRGHRFNLLAHQILAIGTAMDYNIVHDDSDLETLPSVIQIVKLSDKKKGSISVNTDNDSYVIVGLAEEVYCIYAQLGKSVFKATSLSLVLFPALIVIMQRMIVSRDDPDMNSRHWYQVINSILEKNGHKLEDISMENDSLLSICQSVFADPVARSFKELELHSEGIS